MSIQSEQAQTSEIFTIIELDADDEKMVAEVSINGAHEIFKGHFPGAPVMPGVIQLNMVKAAIEQRLGRALRVKAIRSCKFLEVLDPGKTGRILIEAKIKEAETIEVSAAGKWEDVTFFKAQITYL